MKFQFGHLYLPKKQNILLVYSASNYMSKVDYRNTRAMCEMCLKVTIKTTERRQWRRSGVFIVNFDKCRVGSAKTAIFYGRKGSVLRSCKKKSLNWAKNDAKLVIKETFKVPPFLRHTEDFFLQTLWSCYL